MNNDSSHTETAAHTWDSGVVTKEATVDAAGVKTYTCTVCGGTKTESIPKLEPVAPGMDGDEAAQAIIDSDSDEGPAGTKYAPLCAKSTKQTKKSITVTWIKQKNAKKYMIFGGRCGAGKKFKRLAETTSASKTFKKVAGAKVIKGKYYKFIVLALDANNKVVSTSRTVHVAAKGGKVGNHKKVTTKAKKNKATVKVKKTFKLGAKAVAADKKFKVKVHRGIRYESTDTRIATVSKKGVIKGVKKGTCTIYAYVQNGAAAKIKVTVK